MAAKFRSRYNLGENKLFSNPGKETTLKYKEITNEKGDKEFVKDGEDNIYEMIQEAAPDCIIENLLKKYDAGDKSAIEAREALEGIDMTKMPKNIFELKRMEEEAKLNFEKLPMEVRNEYGNNAYKFMTELSTQKGVDKFKKKFKPNFKEMKKETQTKGEE